MTARLQGLLPRLVGASLLLSPGVLLAQRAMRPSPEYVQVGKPDPAEGAKVLEQLRQSTIASDYYLQFELQSMPRKGPEAVYRGEMWVTRNDKGLLTRIGLKPKGEGQPTEQRLLLQNGTDAAVWLSSVPRSPSAVLASTSDVFKPLFDTNISAFDLEMPFIFWTDNVYEGLARILGRPAHKFLLYPPAELTKQYPEMRGVRVYVDTQFNALVQTEIIGEGDHLLKSMTLRDIKKVGDQWVLHSVDFKDEVSRNKTRLMVTGAAFNPELPRTNFEPGMLGSEAKRPPPEKISSL